MIQLTDEMKTAINGALMNRTPVMVASVAPDGQPSISFRGSAQAYSDTQLAFWARNPDGGVLKAILVNPKLTMMYRNPEARTTWLFHGEARRDDDETVRTTVFDNSPEPERNADPEREGVAVIVDIIRVLERGQVLMARDE